MTIFTIGHYNYNLETFLEMLEKAKITKIIDVRSFPKGIKKFDVS